MHLHPLLPSTLTLTLTGLAFLSRGAQAWHTTIHNQLAFMAEEMLNSEARSLVSTILASEPQYQGSIGRAAAWADEVSRTSHKYSYQWHWISARDSPPDHCELHYHRDCPDAQCAVGQIANQTAILEGCARKVKQGTLGFQGKMRSAVTSDEEETEAEEVKCREALKWVVHFIGDVAQPMHTSEKSLGGNLFKVTWNQTDTNMHQVWDRFILYTATQTFPDGFQPTTEIHPHFTRLLKRLRDDALPAPRSGFDMCDWRVDWERGVYCPERWAKDSNALVCDFAYGRYVNGSDLYLDGYYGKDAVELVELQIAKGAWRLAGWLNGLAYRVSGKKSATEDRLLLQPIVFQG